MAEAAPDEALAKKRFLAINLSRIAGVILILTGFAIANGAIGWPQWTAYVLIFFGMFDVFIFPVILSRRWSSSKKP